MMVTAGLLALVAAGGLSPGRSPWTWRRAGGRHPAGGSRHRAALRGQRGRGGAAGLAVFGVHPLLGAISVLVSLVLIDVCVRTAGETDIAPLGALGQLVQLLLGCSRPAGAGERRRALDHRRGGGARRR